MYIKYTLVCTFSGAVEPSVLVLNMRDLGPPVFVAPWLHLLLSVVVVVIFQCFALKLEIDSGVGFF